MIWLFRLLIYKDSEDQKDKTLRRCICSHSIQYFGRSFMKIKINHKSLNDLDDMSYSKDKSIYNDMYDVTYNTHCICIFCNVSLQVSLQKLYEIITIVPIPGIWIVIGENICILKKFIAKIYVSTTMLHVIATNDINYKTLHAIQFCVHHYEREAATIICWPCVINI